MKTLIVAAALFMATSGAAMANGQGAQAFMNGFMGQTNQNNQYQQQEETRRNIAAIEEQNRQLEQMNRQMRDQQLRDQINSIQPYKTWR